jgi:hypothetical protein
VKRVVGAWIVVFVVTAIAGSCAINHRSGEFECTKQSDCSGGRVCQDGFCVQGTGNGTDAGGGNEGPIVPDASSNCPAPCTSCDPGKNECKIDCALTNCTNQVVCPAGMNCDILCTPGNSCRNGVTCQNSKDCNITCSGNSACRNVTCGSGKCDVNCSGAGSCRGVSCGQACSCDVLCTDLSCDTVLCTAPQCGTIQGGCSSQNFGCNNCQM